MTRGFLYRLSFPNGKAYIGITRRTPSVRFAEHVAFAKAGKRLCAVHHAILKSGESNVVVETLAITRADLLAELEASAISKFATRPPHGYNLTDGGDGVTGFDEATRKKMGAANIGRTTSAETRAKLSAAGTGRRHSSESRMKVSEARMGMKFSDEHRANLKAARQAVLARGEEVKISDETRAKMSAAKTGIRHSEETKKKLAAINSGKRLSAETRAKISASNYARWAARKASIPANIVGAVPDAATQGP